MDTMFDALKAAGALTQGQVHAEEARVHNADAAEQARRLQEAKVSNMRFGRLRNESDPAEFRSEARKLLRAEPYLVRDVLALAHVRSMNSIGNKKRGGGRLIANLYQLRNALTQPSLTLEEKRALVDRLFPDKG